MFSLAKKLAQKSKHKQHHHACIITKGGAIVSMASNSKFTHAEKRAIYQVLEWRGKYTIYSLRWRKNGTWGNAKPCADCQQFIDEIGITKVYYTNSEGKLVRL